MKPAYTRMALAAFLALVITGGVFLPSLNHGFLGYDDSVLFENRQWRGWGGENIKWWFTNYLTGDFKPLVWATYMVDYTVWELNPRGYHLGNILIHALNVALLAFLIFSVWGGRFSSILLSILFFSLHPLRVESVVWITERKDVLFVFFFLISILFYIRYIRRSGSRAGQMSYFLSLLAALCSTLSKPQAVSLPFILILFDLLIFRKSVRSCGSLFRDKIPYILFALGGGWAAVYGQLKSGALVPLAQTGLGKRVFLAFQTCFFYLGKEFWPFDLYPLYAEQSSFFWGLWFGGGIILISLIFLVRLRRGQKLPFFAWGWFLITWLPVSGLFRTGGVIQADRFTYLPSLGLSFLLFFVLEKTSPKLKKVVIFLVIIVLLCFCTLTVSQISYWHDPFTLWPRTLAYNPQSYLAHNNLGIAFFSLGKYEEALTHYRQALRIKPDYTKARANLGLVLAGRGDHLAAIKHYEQSLQWDPENIILLSNLGATLADAGEFTPALLHLKKAQMLAPHDPVVQGNLGNAYLKQGDLDRAQYHLDKALELSPNDPVLLNSLGIVAARQQRFARAEELFLLATRADRQNPESLSNLGNALMAQGRSAQAVEVFQASLSLDPESVEARYSLGLAWAAQGRYSLAIEELEKVLQLEPGLKQAQTDLNQLRQLSGSD